MRVYVRILRLQDREFRVYCTHEADRQRYVLSGGYFGFMGGMMDLKPNSIAFYLILIATFLMVTLFFMTRQDPSLRTGALFAGTGLVSAITAIASTLLVGRDVQQKDLPPGSKVDASVHTEVPPTPKA